MTHATTITTMAIAEYNVCISNNNTMSNAHNINNTLSNAVPIHQLIP